MPLLTTTLFRNIQTELFQFFIFVRFKHDSEFEKSFLLYCFCKCYFVVVIIIIVFDVFELKANWQVVKLDVK